jgi:hypothetical protein
LSISPTSRSVFMPFKGRNVLRVFGVGAFSIVALTSLYF